MRLRKNKAGTLIRAIAPHIKFVQVPGIEPASEAGASRLSLSDKDSMSLLLCKQLTERLVKAQSTVAQVLPRHPTPYLRQYSPECTQELQISACYIFFFRPSRHIPGAQCATRSTYILEADGSFSLCMPRMFSSGLSDSSIDAIEHGSSRQALVREIHI